jgi:multidrug efflux pump subunit AcrA (membrane-fusion protein)
MKKEIKKEVKKEKLIQIGKWIVIALAVIIAGRIAASCVMGAKKPKEVVYNIGSVKLAKQSVPHIMSVQGILEGDPQVKVYPQVPGKFAKNNVSEGQKVNRGDVLVYIDRDMVGGTVTKLYYIDKGDAVSPQMPVAEVANDDNVKVVFNLGQDDLLKAHVGQKASIFYINDQAFSVEGEIASVPPVIDKDIMAGTVVVKAANKAGSMKIGMSVNVEILTDTKVSFMVPEKAVLLGEQNAYVFINRENKAVMISVTTGYRQNDLMEISGPLAEGDDVITDGNFKLYDGAKVTVTAAPAVVTGTASDAAGNTKDSKNKGFFKGLFSQPDKKK